jgi:hypothetical protein
MTAVAFSTFSKRLPAAVRRRTAANGDSTELDVRRCFQSRHALPFALDGAPRLDVATLRAVDAPEVLDIEPKDTSHSLVARLLT